MLSALSGYTPHIIWGARLGALFAFVRSQGEAIHFGQCTGLSLEPRVGVRGVVAAEISHSYRLDRAQERRVARSLCGLSPQTRTPSLLAGKQ
jgi:hypothetical protein